MLVRNRGRWLVSPRPVGEQAVEFLDHRVAVEIAADGQHKIRGEEPAPMKREQIIARDGLNRGFGGVTVIPEIFAVGQEAGINLLDGGRTVVALLHGLQHLLFLQVNAVLLEPRFGQDFTQNRQPLVEVLRQQIQAHRALRAGNAGAELRREERQPLLQFLRRAGFRAGAREQ